MSDNHDPQTPPTRGADGRFGPGNPGKPFGATNRAGRDAAGSFLADFEANRDEFLRNLREHFPVEYARTITRIMPKAVVAEEPAPARDWAEDDLARAYDDVRRLVRVETDPRAAMAGIERIFTLPRESRG